MINKDLHELIKSDIICREIYDRVYYHFNCPFKTSLWFIIPNPVLDKSSSTPLDWLKWNRSKSLLRLIKGES